tara:strand:+ start:244 stop:822 length:579 start_codon:yes stop_codon:yes gene_type:complete
MKRFWFVQCAILLICANHSLGSEAGMPQLDPKFWSAQIFWLILIFSVLYLVIWKIFLPKITYSIENRKSRIINDLDEASKLKENAEKKLLEYNKIIEKTKKEAKKIIDDNRKKLDKDIEEKKQKFNDEMEKEIIAAENEIRELKKSSISNINTIAVETSAEVIKQIINTEVNRSNLSAIVDDVIKNEVKKNI